MRWLKQHMCMSMWLKHVLVVFVKNIWADITTLLKASDQRLEPILCIALDPGGHALVE